MKLEENLYLKSLYRYKFHSLLSRIFTSYIGLLFIVMIINVAVYFYVRNIIVEKEAAASEDYLSYVSMIVDGELTHVKEMMYGFLKNSDTVKKLNNIGTNIYNQPGFIASLTNLKNNSVIVGQCFLYNKDLPYVIGNSGTLSKEILFQSFSLYFRLKPSQIENILEKRKDFMIILGHREPADTPNSSSNTQTISQADNTILLVTGENFSSNINRLIVTIDEQNIRNVIIKTNIINYGNVYLVNNGGYVLSSSEASKTGKRFDRKLLARISDPNKTHKFNFHNNLVVFQKSRFIDGYYITVIPYNNMLHNFNTIRNIFSSAFILLIILGLLFALFYSRKLYGPVLALMNKLTGARTGEPEYRDEFAFITNRLDSIQGTDQNDEASMGRMIETGDYPEEVAGEFPYDSFLAVVFTSYNTAKLMEYIQGYLGGHPFKNMVRKIAKGNEGDCYLLLNGNHIDIESVTAYLAEMKESLENSYNFFMFIGIGSICLKLEETGASLRNAFTAIRQGACQDEQCIFHYNEKAREIFKIYFPMDFEDRMLNLLISGSPEKVANLIQTIFDQNNSLPHLYMKIIYTQFINGYIKIAAKYHQPFQIEAFETNIENEYRPSKLRSFLTGMYHELIPVVGEAPQNTPARVECFVIEFIEQNYQDANVSIEQVGEELKLSASYVSTLFKRSTGTAFSQYLLEYRINKAKELLVNTDYSVKEISWKVGFGTYNSFIRSFSKTVGISPGEYRNVNRRKQLRCFQ